MAKDRFNTSRGEKRGRLGNGRYYGGTQAQFLPPRLPKAKHVTAEEMNAKIDRQIEVGYQKILEDLGLID